MGTRDINEVLKKRSTVFFLLASIATLGHGLSLRQCQSNFIDVDMDSSNNEVTCEGAEGTENIEWRYNDGGVNTGGITCDPSGQCNNNALFTATRTAGSTSSRLTFKRDVKRFRDLYGSFILTCQTADPSNPAVITGKVSCQIDVVPSFAPRQ